jgi:hypothetical protein
VTVAQDGRLRVGVASYANVGTITPADRRRWVLAELAVADYMDAHPPVDEAQVKALAEEVRESRPRGVGDYDDETIARHLIAQGWTKGGAE